MHVDSRCMELADNRHAVLTDDAIGLIHGARESASRSRASDPTTLDRKTGTIRVQNPCPKINVPHSASSESFETMLAC